LLAAMNISFGFRMDRLGPPPGRLRRDVDRIVALFKRGRNVSAGNRTGLVSAD